MPRELAAGERVALAEPVVHFRVTAHNAALLAERVGALVIGLDARDRAPSDFAPAIATQNDTRPGVAFHSDRGARFELSAVPDHVVRLLLVAYMLDGPDSGLSFNDLHGLTVEIDDTHRFALDLRDRHDRALILVEAYRRGGQWKLAAHGQGFREGLPGVARAFHVELDVRYAEPARASGVPEERRPAPGEQSGGSGFAVAPRLVVTNHHVIRDAARVTTLLGGHTSPARVVACDPVNDLALVETEREGGEPAAFRADLDLELGDDLVALGFPLQGLLGHGPQLSAGNVAALTGLNNDSCTFQFNAPIASGHSGGPVLDEAGLVIGMVRSVLRLPDDHQNIAQACNFAIRGAVIRSFLHAHGVVPRTVARSGRRVRGDIARGARNFLHRIHVEH